MLCRCFSAIFLIAAALLFLPDQAVPAAEKNSIKIENSVVKITVASQSPDFYSPWRMKKVTSGSGSGFIIKGGRIMTNAHVVANAKYIILQKYNDPQKYTASIEHIGHDCDLAVLKVHDESFFEGTTEFNFTGVPQINDTVYAYGYPVGGEKVSVTRGIVSRIDYSRYSHSAIDYHLSVQIDAAINPGNSGGPIIKEGQVVGVAFQSLMWAENSSYMIPYPVIERFLRDISDGTYDGYIELGFYYQDLENTAMRDFYKLTKEQSGVLITGIFMDNAREVFQKGDILLSIDGYDIANDGTIIIWNERLPLTEAAEIKLPHEKVEVEFLRKGKVLQKKLVLEKFLFDMDLANSYDKMPEYLIVGGFVFVPLSREFLKTWGKGWYDKANKKLLYYFFNYISDSLYKQMPSAIVISRRLPDPVNTYSEDYEDLIVDKVNGQEVRTLKDMRNIVHNLKDKYLIIELQNDVTPVVLKADTIHEADARIMKRYNIKEMEYLEK